MNIQANLRKVYNDIKNLQIPIGDITPDNGNKAIYLAGMLYSASLFINLYNGDMNEETLAFELERLKNKISQPEKEGHA